MGEGLFQPMHVLIMLVILAAILVPAFVVLRLLWKLGTRLGRPPAPPNRTTLVAARVSYSPNVFGSGSRLASVLSGAGVVLAFLR
jgi:hypothetical protein